MIARAVRNAPSVVEEPMDFVLARSPFPAARASELEEYWGMAKSDGFEVWAFTILPVGLITNLGFLKNDTRMDINSRIMTSDVPDRIVDVANLYPDALDQIYYLSDRVHLTVGSNEMLATYLSQVFQSGCSSQYAGSFVPQGTNGYGAFVTDSLKIRGDLPGFNSDLVFSNQVAPLDEKNWSFKTTDAGDLYLRSLPDSLASEKSLVIFRRSGIDCGIEANLLNVVINNGEFTIKTSSTAPTATAGVLITGGNAGANWFLLTNRADITGANDTFALYKAAGTVGMKFSVNDAGDAKSSGKMLATGGLGAGNTAVATTLGTVARRMEIFSDTGTSLGFIPIYNSIT
jgi:hypothetical protein